jgi:hypothetical protein
MVLSGVSKVVCESTLPVFVTGFSQANPLQPNPCGGEPPEEGGWFEKGLVGFDALHATHRPFFVSR